MSDFIKFPSIENSYQEKNICIWLGIYPELKSESFILTEKVDGSNFQVIITQDTFQFATRTRILAEDESFYNWQEVVKSTYEEQFSKIQNYLIDEGHSSIHLYGELFGDGIQRRINYIKNKDFKLFEMRLNESLLSIKEARSLLTEIFDDEFTNNWWVPVLAITDNLDEAMSFQIEDINTSIGEELDGNRKIEGVVIAPYEKAYLKENADGGVSAFRLKKKSEKFNDKSVKREKVNLLVQRTSMN